MSLFPAYAENISGQSEKQEISETERTCSKDVTDQNWLQNSSCQEISTLVTNLQGDNWTDSSEDEVSVVASSSNIKTSSDKNVTKIVKKKNHKTRKKLSNDIETNSKNIYFEDRKRNKKISTLDTLGHEIRPSYKSSTNKLGLKTIKKQKRKKYVRYYTINLNSKRRKTDDPPGYDDNESTEILNFAVNQENEIQNKQKEAIEEFNIKLAENPKDVSTWLKYVNFQDHVVQLQQFSKKSDSKHLVNQKKLSIVEKGLNENSDSTELLKLKMQLMAQILPVDQFSSQIEAMIQKDPKNFVLWQVLILIIQTSCSLSKVSKILNYYVKCFAVLKQKSKTDAKFYDEQVLGLLYQCLTFLRHAGLWEQMWEIIKINLCLNLTLEQETLENINVIDDKNLMDMEELILTSQLPLNQLWLRIESLRENCYWTGIDIKKVDVSLVADEKRLVSADEVNDFIYPTISKESNFRIAILSILCLKVPLLPSRHYTLKDFNLDELFWSIDSLEFILPMIYSTVWIGETNSCLCNENVLKNLLEGNLTSGPQFLKFHPAQEIYLDFVRLVFKTIAHKLTGNEKISIFIWWLKFERMLVFITKNDPLREKSRNKKLKTAVKNFLKESENRNNLHYYREFSMIEYELGSFDNCIQILKKIILLQDTNRLNYEEKKALLSLYRTIFEVLLNSNFVENQYLEVFQEVVKSMENFISVCFKHDSNLSILEMLYNEILKFFLESPEDETEESFLLTNIHCDMIICYAYLMYTESADNIEDILDLFDRCLTHSEKCIRLQERFYETKICFLKFCQSKHHNCNISLKKTVHEVLQKCPNNFFFLSVNSLIEIEQPFWKLKTTHEKSTIWAIIATCLAGRARISYFKNIGLEESFTAMVNKMLAFHKKVGTKQEVQGCPLIWRFYMLLLKEHNLCEKKGEEIYYEAISQCPWARSVYISAAEVAPQILTQIQDLIKEKELRIHVTPEELDILRES